jgi:AcrR family transcriptional regulator
VSPLTENGGEMSGSREKLLRSAELLFSAKGFSEVSVREIAAHAGVNTGLIAYYFRGKQALFDEVLRIHATSLSRERMKRLKALTQNNRKPTVEEILKAWLLPWLQLEYNQSADAIHFRITANLSYEKWKETKELFGSSRPVQNAFIKALHSRLPYLSTKSLICRLQFAMSALLYGIQQPTPLIALSGGRCDPTDLEATFIQILPFAEAGFCARESARLWKADCQARR